MAVPTRKQKSISNIKQTSWAEKNKRKEQKEDKPITEEEHKKKVELLKSLGLIKEDS